MVLVAGVGGGGSTPVEPSPAKRSAPTSSVTSSKHSAAGPQGSSADTAASPRQVAQAALTGFKPDNATDENKLETALWSQAMADAKQPRTLLDGTTQLEKAWATIKSQDHLPRGITPAELQTAWRGAELRAAERQLPPQTSRAMAVSARGKTLSPAARARALSGLESATFNEQVLSYEQTRPGLTYEVPGSAPWRKDAAALLGSPAALAAARAAVMATHQQDLAKNGLDLPHFEAALWVGETVEGAKLAQRQGGYARAVSTLATAFFDPNADPANSGLNTGLDPTLARQALTANSYVVGVPSAIATAAKGSAGGISFLAGVVSRASAAPWLATQIVHAAKATLQSSIESQSGTDPEQAAGAYVALAQIYLAMKQAAARSAPGAAELADQVARWSFAVISETSNTPDINLHTGAVIGPGLRDVVLQAIVSQAAQQHVAGNLFHTWLSLDGQPTKAANDADPGWSAFRASVSGDPQLASRPLSSTPLRAAPTAQDLTQDLQAKLSAGQSLSEAINATRAQMAVEYSDPPGDRNEMLLAEAALALTGANNRNTYARDPIAANDPVTRAAQQIAQLNVFDPKVLQRATKTMTAMGTPDAVALRRAAGRASAALQTWQADLAAKKSASLLGQDEQAYHAALTAELNAATGETGSAWLNNPVDIDQLWKAEKKVTATNLAPLRGGNQQAYQITTDDLQNSFAAVAVLADVNATQHRSGSAQAAAELTSDLSGFGRSDPLYQEVMGDGSMQALQAAALKDILDAGGPSAKPEARLAKEATVLAAYEGTVQQPGVLYASLLHAVEASPRTRTLFDEVTPRSLTGQGNADQKLAQVAAVLNPLWADPDLAAALYQAKFAGSSKAGGVPDWIANASSSGDQQTLFADLGQIYSDIGGAQSAQGEQLRHALEARMNGGDPLGMLVNTDGPAGARFGTGRWVREDGLDQVKADGQPMQLYQDIIDEAPRRAASADIEGETGYTASGAAPPKPINATGTDPVGLLGLDGLSAVTTKAELINELGQDEGLQPVRLPQTTADQTALTEGQYEEYSLNQRVFGSTTLGDVVNSVLSASGGTGVSAQTPVALAALPMSFRRELAGPQGLSSPQNLALLEIVGGRGQTRYVGPANVTVRSSFADWEEYNGVAEKGLMLVQPHLLIGANGGDLQSSAYWISNQTDITTWDKVWSDVKTVGGMAAMALTILLPESAPLWLTLVADVIDGYFLEQSTEGTIQAINSLSTHQGRGDWVNWLNLGLNLGASLFGAGAAAGAMLSRAARITERIGVEVDGFETASVSVQTSKEAYEAAHTAYKQGEATLQAAEKEYARAQRAFTASGGDAQSAARFGVARDRLFTARLEVSVRAVLTFRSTRLQRLLRSLVVRDPSSMSTFVQSADRLIGSRTFGVVGGLAMTTNALSVAVQGLQMMHTGATAAGWFQLLNNVTMMGLGPLAERARAAAADPNWWWQSRETTPSGLLIPANARTSGSARTLVDLILPSSGAALTRADLIEASAGDLPRGRDSANPSPRPLTESPTGRLTSGSLLTSSLSDGAGARGPGLVTTEAPQPLMVNLGQSGRKPDASVGVVPTSLDGSGARAADRGGPESAETSSVLINPASVRTSGTARSLADLYLGSNAAPVGGPYWRSAADQQPRAIEAETTPASTAASALGTAAGQDDSQGQDGTRVAPPLVDANGSAVSKPETPNSTEPRSSNLIAALTTSTLETGPTNVEQISASPGSVEEDPAAFAAELPARGTSADQPAGSDDQPGAGKSDANGAEVEILADASSAAQDAVSQHIAPDAGSRTTSVDANTPTGADRKEQMGAASSDLAAAMPEGSLDTAPVGAVAGPAAREASLDPAEDPADDSGVNGRRIRFGDAPWVAVNNDGTTSGPKSTVPEANSAVSGDAGWDSANAEDGAGDASSQKAAASTKDAIAQNELRSIGDRGEPGFNAASLSAASADEGLARGAAIAPRANGAASKGEHEDVVTPDADRRSPGRAATGDRAQEASARQVNEHSTTARRAASAASGPDDPSRPPDGRPSSGGRDKRRNPRRFAARRRRGVAVNSRIDAAAALAEEPTKFYGGIPTPPWVARAAEHLGDWLRGAPSKWRVHLNHAAERQFAVEFDAARIAIATHLRAIPQLHGLIADYSTSDATGVGQAQELMRAHTLAQEAATEHLRAFVTSKIPSFDLHWRLEAELAQWLSGPRGPDDVTDAPEEPTAVRAAFDTIRRNVARSIVAAAQGPFVASDVGHGLAQSMQAYLQAEVPTPVDRAMALVGASSGVEEAAKQHIRDWVVSQDVSAAVGKQLLKCLSDYLSGPPHVTGAASTDREAINSRGGSRLVVGTAPVHPATVPGEVYINVYAPENARSDTAWAVFLPDGMFDEVYLPSSYYNTHRDEHNFLARTSGVMDEVARILADHGRVILEGLRHSDLERGAARLQAAGFKDIRFESSVRPAASFRTYRLIGFLSGEERSGGPSGDLRTTARRRGPARTVGNADPPRRRTRRWATHRHRMADGGLLCRPTRHPRSLVSSSMTSARTSSNTYGKPRAVPSCPDERAARWSRSYGTILFAPIPIARWKCDHIPPLSRTLQNNTRATGWRADGISES